MVAVTTVLVAPPVARAQRYPTLGSLFFQAKSTVFGWE
jgi:hypothetical protein